MSSSSSSSSSSTHKQSAIGIAIGGGPAPGINACIASITIEAINNDLKVFGFFEGFKYLMKDSFDTSKAIELNTDKVEGIDHIGGSILRTSRSNPTLSEKNMSNVLKHLEEFNIKMFITIGGFYTAETAARISKFSSGGIRICHVPKTIDNDLPLPSGIPTFGSETAVEIGSTVVQNLMEDAKTANRFFIVLTMGRTAGHLALSIGKSAGAHHTIIPEQFNLKGNQCITFDTICKCIEGCVLQRAVGGHDHGVIILAEGIIEKLSKEELKKLFGEESIKYDSHGHLVLSELDIGKKIKEEMRERAKSYKKAINFTEKNLGYELRCSPPNAFDLEYARDLGYGAVTFLLKGGNSAMISIQAQNLIPIPFSDIIDTEDRMNVRLVNINSEGFKVAQSYMIGIKKKILKDEDQLKKLADVANMSVDDFQDKFSKVAM